MTTAVVYEHPLNERTRMLLRLEFLFEQAEHSLVDNSVWGCRQSLGTLLEILAVLGRGDVKAEVHKELDRQGQMLQKLQSREDVDHELLRTETAKIGDTSSRLHGSSLSLGQYLKNNEFITAVRSRSALPGGLCEFDVPAYHAWLEHCENRRSEDLKTWYAKLWQLRDAISVCLNLTRNSAAPANQKAEMGNWVTALEPQQFLPMLQIHVPTDFRVFPEVSGGRHRVTIRFLEQRDIEDRARQFDGDVPFKLVMCAL